MCTDVTQLRKEMLESPGEIHQYHWN